MNNQINKQTLRKAIREAGLSGHPVCCHTALSSFGYVEGGAAALVDAYLEEGCTLVVPTFIRGTMVRVPRDCAYTQNGGPLERGDPPGPEAPLYDSNGQDVASSMGALPREVLTRPERVRGVHPINSLTALGPLAKDIISTQTYLDVYGPYARAAELDGFIVLMGVDLTRCTPIHWAEACAGKTLFVRWSLSPNRTVIECSIGSCSSGFERLTPVLAPYETQRRVGQSLWRIFPLAQSMAAAAHALRGEPGLSHCADPDCACCNDMEKGGLLRTPPGAAWPVT